MESTTNAKWNPNTLFPWQTWERYAKGRTLVGVNESDSAFSTVNKTGGAKTHKLTVNEMPSHNHAVTKYSVPAYPSTTGDGKKVYWSSSSSSWGYVGNSSLHSSVGGGAAHNNLQPYVAVYYWRRTA